jgi:hypothetical protein
MKRWGECKPDRVAWRGFNRQTVPPKQGVPLRVNLDEQIVTKDRFRDEGCVSRLMARRAEKESEPKGAD